MYDMYDINAIASKAKMLDGGSIFAIDAIIARYRKIISDVTKKKSGASVRDDSLAIDESVSTLALLDMLGDEYMPLQDKQIILEIRSRLKDGRLDDERR